MDVSQFQELINGYENIIKDLTNELRTVKTEHEDLKNKLPTIINENQQLVEQLNASNTRQECASEFELVENLRDQIILVLQEKEDIKELWQRSIKSVELLENELKLYKSDNLELLPKQQYLEMKQSYDENIKKLHNQLKLSQTSLEEKQIEIQDALESKDTEFKNIKKLETKIDSLKHKILELEDTNEQLRNDFYEKERLMQTTMLKNSEYREKVTEALQVVQAAMNEKDAALLRETAIRSNVQKLNEELDTIVEEIKEKYNKDMSKVNEDANKKYDLLINDFNKISDELKCKTLEVEKYQTKSIILQNEIDKLLSGGLNIEESQTSKLLTLEKNLESTFQKLLVSEKQNIQIKSDYQTLKNDLEQMGTYYERIVKSKEVERSSLQNSIHQLQSFIKEKELNMQGLNNELESLRNENAVTEKEYRKYIETLEEKIDKEKKTYTEKHKELSNKIESTEKLNKKLILETKEIFRQLDALVKTLKAGNHKLKRENEILQHTVEGYKIKVTQCKEMMGVLNLDFSNINNACVNSHTPNILS